MYGSSGKNHDVNDRNDEKRNILNCSFEVDAAAFAEIFTTERTENTEREMKKTNTIPS